MNRSNYEALANAIVEQAARDYELYLCVDRLHSTSLSRANLEEVERFFKGDDIQLYTKCDGVALMKTIKQQVIDYDYDLKALHRARHGLRGHEEDEP